MYLPIYRSSICLSVCLSVTTSSYSSFPLLSSHPSVSLFPSITSHFPRVPDYLSPVMTKLVAPLTSPNPLSSFTSSLNLWISLDLFIIATHINVKIRRLLSNARGRSYLEYTSVGCFRAEVIAAHVWMRHAVGTQHHDARRFSSVSV